MEDYNDINAMLEAEEGGYAAAEGGRDADYGQVMTITVVNGLTSSKREVSVYPENTIGQVVEHCGLRITPKSDFANAATGQTTADTDMTLREFGLKDGDQMIFNPDNNVAAR